MAKSNQAGFATGQACGFTNACRQVPMDLSLSVLGTPTRDGSWVIYKRQSRRCKKAAELAPQQVLQDVDPINQRQLNRQQSNSTDGRIEHLALEAHEKHKKSLKHGGSDGKWFSPLRLHVLPKLGKRPIVKIDQEDIARALELIWQEKPVTAKKCVSKLRTVSRN